MEEFGDCSKTFYLCGTTTNHIRPMTAIIYKTKEEKKNARRRMLERKAELEAKLREKMNSMAWEEACV